MASFEKAVWSWPDCSLAFFLEASLNGAALVSSPGKPFSRDQDPSEACSLILRVSLPLCQGSG